MPSYCKIYEQNAASVIRFPISAIHPFFLRIASPVPEVGSCCSGCANGCNRILMSSRAFASLERCRGSLHVGNYSDDYRLVLIQALICHHIYNTCQLQFANIIFAATVCDSNFCVYTVVFRFICFFCNIFACCFSSPFYFIFWVKLGLDHIC